MEISTLGALIGFILSVLLIIKKITPIYSLMTGALIAGLIGGATLVDTISVMISGVEEMVPSILRILSSGILAGILIQTKSAEKIADFIVSQIGSKHGIISITFATALLTAAGVFVDIAIITIAPIALAIGRKAGYSIGSILLAMIGGGKSGNIVSPNPNTIVVAENFNIDLIELIKINVFPAIFGIITTIILANYLHKKEQASTDNVPVTSTTTETNYSNQLPSIFAAIIGPITLFALLILRPLIGVTIDPFVALPIGGLVTACATKSLKQLNTNITYGLSQVSGIAILFIGTGTLAGVIKASNLQLDLINILQFFDIPTFVLAPLSGILLGGVTASTTAGAAIASSTFHSILVEQGLSALSAGAMLHAGAIVIPTLPHGSFFHATGGCVGMTMTQRLRLVPAETLVGVVATLVSIMVYLQL